VEKTRLNAVFEIFFEESENKMRDEEKSFGLKEITIVFILIVGFRFFKTLND